MNSRSLDIFNGWSLMFKVCQRFKDFHFQSQSIRFDFFFFEAILLTLKYSLLSCELLNETLISWFVLLSLVIIIGLSHDRGEKFVEFNCYFYGISNRQSKRFCKCNAYLHYIYKSIYFAVSLNWSCILMYIGRFVKPFFLYFFYTF